MKKKKVIAEAFKAAFPHTIPILAGFSFLGFSFGVLMNVSGFSFWYPLVMSIIVFGGSIEFVAVSMLLSPFAPIQTLIMSLMIQARHLFYGLSMLDKYKNVGIKKYYLIFGMCDETFSINCSVDIPEGIDKGWFMTAVTLLDHLYWINGSLIGLFASVICLLIFGSDSFMIPTMLLILFLLTALRKPIEKGGGLE